MNNIFSITVLQTTLPKRRKEERERRKREAVYEGMDWSKTGDIGGSKNMYTGEGIGGGKPHGWNSTINNL